MQELIIDFVGQYGYLSIFLLIMIENIIPPIPSELVLAIGGFMTTIADLSIIGVVFAATAGSVIGAVLLYCIGLSLNAERLLKLIKRSDIDTASAWFLKYGYWGVLVGRLIPLIRSVISIPAGIARMKFKYFLLFTILGAMFWNMLLVHGGAYLGSSWPDLLRVVRLYTNVLVAIAGLFLIAFIAFRLFRRRQR